MKTIAKYQDSWKSDNWSERILMSEMKEVEICSQFLSISAIIYETVQSGIVMEKN